MKAVVQGEWQNRVIFLSLHIYLPWDGENKTAEEYGGVRDAGKFISSAFVFPASVHFSLHLSRGRSNSRRCLGIIKVKGGG